MNLTAVTSRAAAALVAAVAGFASYRHIYDVATGAGEHQGVAAVLPLAIDGLILVATLAMLDDKRQQRRPRLSARVALVFGILATLCANVASAEPTGTARMVAAIPAISFLLAIEVLARSGKPVPAAPATEAASTVATSTPPDSELTAIADAIVDAIPPATDTPPRPVTLATPEPATNPTPRPAKRTTVRATSARQNNAQRVATKLAKEPDMTQAEVAKVLGLSERTVQRYWPKPPAAVNGHHPQEVTQ